MHGHEGVTVTGSAAVDVEPDIVVAEVGVDVREPDVTTALRTAEERLALMRDAFLERRRGPSRHPDRADLDLA